MKIAPTNRVYCPFCKNAHWYQPGGVISQLMILRDHDRPDGRKCLKAARYYRLCTATNARSFETFGVQTVMRFDQRALNYMIHAQEEADE